MGKKTNKDISRGKETFITFLEKKMQKKSLQLIGKAKDLLKPFGKKAFRLTEITDYIISRNK